MVRFVAGAVLWWWQRRLLLLLLRRRLQRQRLPFSGVQPGYPLIRDSFVASRLYLSSWELHRFPLLPPHLLVLTVFGNLPRTLADHLLKRTCNHKSRKQGNYFYVDNSRDSWQECGRIKFDIDQSILVNYLKN